MTKLAYGELRAKVMQILADTGGATCQQVADIIGTGYNIVHPLLERLHKSGRCVRRIAPSFTGGQRFTYFATEADATDWTLNVLPRVSAEVEALRKASKAKEKARQQRRDKRRSALRAAARAALNSAKPASAVWPAAIVAPAKPKKAAKTKREKKAIPPSKAFVEKKPSHPAPVSVKRQAPGPIIIPADVKHTIMRAPAFDVRYGVDPAKVPALFSALPIGRYIA